MGAYKDIYDKLTAYCDCVDEATEKDVEDLINIISMATGWTSKPCETFLMSSRREVIDLPSCLDCAFEFEPFYTPFEPDSFTFTFVKQEGITEESEVVTDYAYSTTDDNFKINLPLDSCCCSSGCDLCNTCETKYKLLVTYDAGYEDIPDCLLPVFCNLLNVVHAKNDCDCDDCQTCDTNYDNEPKIKYASGDVVTVALAQDIGKILVEQYKNQIALIGLYGRDRRFWGYVV